MHFGRRAAEAGAEPEPVRWKKEYTRRTEWFLEHHLMISDFRCNLELTLRETPDVELVTWDQSRDTWFRVTIPNQRHRTARVAPDAYFVLRDHGDLRYFFLEVDRGTEEHRRLVEKFTAYWWYLQDPRFTVATRRTAAGQRPVRHDHRRAQKQHGQGTSRVWSPTRGTRT